ncbi:MAG: UDP-N-acetylmuramate dehydrogenase [Saprospiraceae bacterium]
MTVQENVSLRQYNTFGIDQYAGHFVQVRELKDLLYAIDFDSKHIIIGGGSNLLLTRDIDGLVIKNDIKGIEELDNNKEYVLVKVFSGENWHSTVSQMVSKGWGGIENLSLIPGTVGAAPIQNIGAYGVEIKDVLVAVEAIELATGKILEFSNEECQFGYRDSFFKSKEAKGKYFVYSLTLRLNKHGKINTQYGEIEKKLREKNILNPTIMDMHQAIMEIRQNKLPDPAIIGNAGSFFKNPILPNALAHELKEKSPNLPMYKWNDHESKVAAGWLIDQAGWKGKRIGHVGCYEKQALVIVNHGNATGSEVLDFSKLVQDDILNKYGIAIEPEINIW